MASLSRSAGSPALPTAMTTRPQLASSPAMAVLTSGELAIDLAMRKALASLVGAFDVDRHQLGGAFAVAHHLDGEIVQHVAERLAEDFGARIVEAGDRRRCRGLAGGEDQQRVGGRGVAVDGDGVEAGLRRGWPAAPAAPARRSACR